MQSTRSHICSFELHVCVASRAQTHPLYLRGRRVWRNIEASVVYAINARTKRSGFRSSRVSIIVYLYGYIKNTRVMLMNFDTLL